MGEAVKSRQSIAKYFAERRGTRITFSPKPHYVRSGDFLTIFFTGDFAYSERVDNVLTIYRAEKSGEIVGCKIKGVSLLAENVRHTFDIIDDDIEIRLLLLNAMGPKEPRHHYYDVAVRTKGMTIPAKEIFRAAA